MVSNPMVIPVEDRYANLKQILVEYVGIIAAIRSGNPNLAQQQPSLFSFLAFPWLADDAQLTSEQKDFLRRRKIEVSELKFDGERVKRTLDEVLASDKHLKESCLNRVMLANYLDLYFIKPVTDAKEAGTTEAQIEFAFTEFERQTYHQGRFRRIALSHLFNFNMDDDSIVFECDAQTVGTIRIERIAPNTIPQILGESGFQAFLHPLDAGNCFVVEEEGSSDVDDFQWLTTKRSKAYFFAEVLQYFKDGVVHLGYSAPFFLPLWAHQIRRQGLFFTGNARRMAYQGGKKPYHLSKMEKQHLERWWKVITTPTVLEALENKKGKLRQATYRAAQYYEASHDRPEPVERLIALAIGLESLFSPGDQGELSYRISQLAAQFIGNDPEERKTIFSGVKELYSRRSKLVHGTYDVDKYDKGEFVTADEIDRWSVYLRRAYLGFMALYLKAYLAGKKAEAREPILERIGEANFNDAEGAKLRDEANIETLLAELST
jgi:Apea-like HEPN